MFPIFVGVVAVLVLIVLVLYVPSMRAQTTPEQRLRTGVILRVPGEFASIQAAIDAAKIGDRVIVSPGVYRENIDFGGKAIQVTSERPDDERTRRATIIQGDGRDSVVIFSMEEPIGTSFCGFTVTGGRGHLIIDQNLLGNAARVGGGIFIGSEAAPTISNNIITNNEADMGGGIYTWSNSLAVLNDNTLSENQAVLGGGIRVAWDFQKSRATPLSSKQTFLGRHAVEIRDCLIADNEAHIGGGVSVGRSATPDIIHNTIHGNRARWDGAGISVWDNSRPRIINNVIRGNRAGSVYGLGGAISVMNNSKPVVKGNTFLNNEARGTQASGGGGVAFNRSEPAIQENVFRGNRAAAGADIFCWGTARLIQKERLERENETSGDGVEFAGDLPPWPEA